MASLHPYLHQGIAYAAATVAAVAAGMGSHVFFEAWHLLVHVAIADVVGTFVIFGFSRFYDNSSLYDPYWSVAPIVIALTYLAISAAPTLPAIVVTALVTVWGIRLTYNFLSGWSGLDHEDWRYRNFRAQFPRAYWLVSLGGIHMFPTVLVFLGCLPIYASLFPSSEPMPLLQVVGAIITLAAIAIETIADRQLRAFVTNRPDGVEILQTGLWKYSRHPNYFGELSFWWGLWIFGAGTSPADALWTLVGPVAMTVLFVVISIPMLDKRSLARRAGYAEHMKRVSSLLPLPPRER